VIPPAERERLLGVARSAVRAAADARLYDPAPEPPVDVQGVFVTLRRRQDHDLRGCIGSLRPATEGLPRLVADAARSAALRDPRFPQVRPGEVDALSLEISVLGPLAPIAPHEVEVGRHGLVLRARGRSGLLLPQVPAEHGLDRGGFLEALCRKAGVPPGTHAQPGAELLGFEAEVFGEG
jgi:AmmeMemoRadiSam system protein A